MAQDDEQKLNELWAKIREYYENPRIAARIDRIYDKLDSRRQKQNPEERLAALQVGLETLGTIEASFAAAEFYIGESELALSRLNKSVVYLFASLQSTYEFWRARSDSRILDHPTPGILICQSGSYLFGYLSEATWLAERVAESYAQQEHWVQSGGYLADFLVSLALLIGQSETSLSDSKASSPQVRQLFTSSAPEERTSSFQACLSYRLVEAHRVQMNMVEDEFLDYAIAGIPIELLTYAEIIRERTGEIISTSHAAVLPAFRSLVGVRGDFTDVYVDEIRQLTQQYTGKNSETNG